MKFREGQVNDKFVKNQYIGTSEFYSQVIDSLRDYSIITIDNDLLINSWNSGATAIFQYEPEEILGKSLDIIYSKEDIKAGIPNQEIQRALKEGRAVDNRWHVCKDGSSFFANGLVFPIYGKDEELIGYVKILRDLTERKKSEEAIIKYVKELEELNEHKEHIVAILSHDLRSPLARIISIADYLKSANAKVEPEELLKMLNFIYDAGREELNMLDYLVDWARIKYASQTFSPSNINLNEFVIKVLTSLKETTIARNITVINEIDTTTSVYADNKMINSVFQNIILNAIKHTPDGGKVVIKARKQSNDVVVEIHDNGYGMSEEVLKNIFTPQLNKLSNPKEANKGAGIGLLLTKSFIDKNSGEIWVKSQVGEGSTFYFTLPADEATAKLKSIKVTEFDKSI